MESIHPVIVTRTMAKTTCNSACFSSHMHSFIVAMAFIRLNKVHVYSCVRILIVTTFQ